MSDVGPEPAGPDPARDVLGAVVVHLHGCLGEEVARAGVTFLGVEPIEVLQFRRDGRTVFATLGMARHPMTDPVAVVADPVAGPRAELLLLATRAWPELLRPLAVLAAMPAVEGVVVGPGATFDLGAPLVTGSRCTGVLVDDPWAEVGDLVLGGGPDPVRFLPVVGVTPEEAAYKRVHGAPALWAQWHREGTDLADLLRPGVRLAPPA